MAAADYARRPSTGYADAAETIENLGAILAARYGQAEQRMIRLVRDALRAGIEADQLLDVAARARVLADLAAQGSLIAAALADDVFVASLVAIASQEGRAAAASLLSVVGVPTASGVSPTAANAVAALALDLTSELDAMSARITRWMPDIYQRAVNELVPDVILGVDTIAGARQRAVERMLADGVRGFTDAAGKEWRIGTYAEMATRTSMQRAWIDAHAQRMTEAGQDLVTIIGGVDSCSRCAPWVGLVYSLSGRSGDVVVDHATDDRPVTVSVRGGLDVARAGGWGHPNCRCTIAAYFAGLTIPARTTYDPQREKDRDQLRALERRKRELRRREAAALSDVEEAAIRRRVREVDARIRQHVAETGQVRKRYREQLAFSDGSTVTPRPALERVRNPAT